MQLIFVQIFKIQIIFFYMETIIQMDRIHLLILISQDAKTQHKNVNQKMNKIFFLIRFKYI
jgi:hypothetical protein